MSDFKLFKAAVQKQFDELTENGELFTTQIGKDELWEAYLDSFPEGTNKIYKERREYDCQCCKQFIRACGNVVGLVNNKMVSLWDLSVPGYYQEVADALAKLVKSKPIANVFRHYQNDLGTDKNRQLLESGGVITWNHFHYSLHDGYVLDKDRIGTALSESRARKEVFKRGLTELTSEALDTVIELIEQNSLYRGEEFLRSVRAFEKYKKEFDQIDGVAAGDNYCWSHVGDGVTMFRNSAIGTLVTDISDGMGLDEAVRLFESKVAPMNYKRPTAVVTKAMIEKAKKKVEELGIGESLPRRYAVIEDITINNVLWADREAKQAMDVFDEMVQEAPANAKHLDKVDEVSIKDFIDNILPKAESLELLFENSHANNLVSLIAPKYPDAKRIFKWGNNFSWAYTGDIADSIKQRVKAAGGNVEGILRASLSWYNGDDLDIHAKDPGGNHIYFNNAKRIHSTSGVLDVDMNAGGVDTREPVENIVWTDERKMKDGVYEIWVNQYRRREGSNIGFEVEIEYGGEINTFAYNEAVRQGANVPVAKFEIRKGGLTYIDSLPMSTRSKDVWGVSTQKFMPVSTVMFSPNHWDGEETGNRHYFFMLHGCKQEGKARGFFNEFLNEEINEHRKVFEVLGSKLRVEESDDQLSGLGFSSTQRNHVFCKVTGSFSRTIKINF